MRLEQKGANEVVQAFTLEELIFSSGPSQLSSTPKELSTTQPLHTRLVSKKISSILLCSSLDMITKPICQSPDTRYSLGMMSKTCFNS